MKKILFLICLLSTSFVSAQDNSQVRGKYNQALKLSTDEATLNESLNIFNKVIAVDPTFQYILEYKMQVLDDLGRTKEAMEVINEMKKISCKERLPFVYLVKGLFDERYGDISASKVSYSKALKLSKKVMMKDKNKMNVMAYLLVGALINSSNMTKDEMAKFLPESMRGAKEKKIVDETYDCIYGLNPLPFLSILRPIRSKYFKFINLRKAMYKKGFLLKK